MDDGTEALRCLAPCWNLAGDDKLLNILQNTHQNIISRCNDVNSKLGDMAAALDSAAVTLQNVNNRFMSLSNKQFIESRVYDDDADVVPDSIPVKEAPKVPTQDSTLESLRRSLQVLDKTHESITILEDTDSDTESEDDMPARTVLRPKDMYSDRPLPYIIGSQQWKNKWHAGLVVEDSDSDSSGKRSEQSVQYSDSEPETQPDTLQPARPTDDRTISETSSELPSDQDMVSVEKQKPADVAAELARRLGGHLPQISEPHPDFEPEPAPTKLYKPLQPNTGPIFSDEPPPLASSSSEEDIFAELHKKQPHLDPRPVTGLFAGGNRKQLFGEEEEIGEADVFGGLDKPTKSTKNATLAKGVVGPESATEKTPYSTSDDVDNRGVKKPVGGISLFGTNQGAESIGAAILNRNRRKSSTSGDESVSDTAKPPTHPKREVVEKTESEQREKDIFDDLFAKAQKADKTKPTFDAKDVVKAVNKKKNETKVEPAKVDLFSDNIFDDIDDIFTNTPVKVAENTKKSVFDDDDDLFSEIAAPKPIKTVAEVSRTNTKGLFESHDELFADNKEKNAQNVSKNDTGVKDKLKDTASVKTNPVKSIFDDDDDDDLFSDIKNVAKDRSNNQKVQNTVSKSNNVDNIVKPSETKVFNSPSLFDDDDDDTDLFSTPKPSHSSKTTITNNENKNGTKSAGNDNLFSSKKENILPKIEESIDSKLVEKTENTLNSINVNIVNKVDDQSNITKKAEDSSKKLNISSEVSSASHSIKDSIRKPISDEESDFEQDFDDLPPRVEEKSNVNIKIDAGTNMTVNINVVTEGESDVSKKDDIFDSDEDLFTKTHKKPLEITVQTQPNETNVSMFNEPKNALLDDKLEDDLCTNNVKEAVDTSTNISIVEEFSSSNEDKQINILSKTNNLTDRQVVSEKKPQAKNADLLNNLSDNQTSVGNHTDSSKLSNVETKDVFDELFSEPPIFEKPKEPKKSKNVNALFDDDSEDEALFFKKNDIIGDEVPADYKTSQDNLFGVFRDEPPDVDLNLKADSDEDLFSSLPKPNIPTPTTEVDTESNKNVHTTLLRETKITKSDDYLEERKSSPDDNLFKTIPKNKPESQNTNVVDIFSDDDDLFNTQKTKHNVQPQSITETIKTVTDEDNLFSSKTQNKSVITELLKDETKTGLKTDEDLFKHKTTIGKTNTYEDINQRPEHEELFMSLPTYINSEFQKSTLIKPDLGNKSNTESPKKVGKLKTMNFNINVNALLPGSSPKKQKTAEEKHSPTESTDTTDDKKPETKPAKAVNFEAESSILDNKISKERAKIQVKRRPSTRRARQEAARKSGIDFGEDSTDNSSSIDDPPKNNTEAIKSTEISVDLIKETLPQPENIVPESPNTDRPYSRDVKSKVVYILNDEDIFNTVTNTDTDNDMFKTDINKDITNTDSKSDTTEDIFKGDQITDTNKNKLNADLKTESDDDIFNTATKTDITKDKADINTNMLPESSTNLKADKPKLILDKKERSIFDSDSDSELFSSKKEKKIVKKGPLFSDDDDDDLFGVKTKRKDEPIPQAASTSAKEMAKTTEIVFDDPLSILSDDD